MGGSRGFKRALAEALGENVRYAPSSYDIVGSREGAIAIVEFPEGAPESVKKLVAEFIMRVNKHVRVVLEKASERRGVYRLREYRTIAGGGSTEVIHVEHGVRLKLDPTKVYFSPREATERLRVANQVRPGEFVMVMFAGVGPYALMIAKKQPLVAKVVAIELNPVAYNYMLENVRLNKLEGKVVPVLGDVKIEAKHWFGVCDRVVMPLPRGAHMFLDVAFQCLKAEGGILHFYHWAPENDLYTGALAHLEREARLRNVKIEVLDARVVSEYAPRTYKVCLDVLVRPAAL